MTTRQFYVRWVILLAVACGAITIFFPFFWMAVTSLKPMADLLHGIVRDIVGPAIPDPAVRTCALSVIGQCCFYRHAREVITRMYGADAYTPASIELIADHITRFSLAGFTACTP